MKTAFGLNIPQTLEDVCDPRRTALLVYDMQVGILSQIKNSKQITRKVLEVLTAALKREFASSSLRRRNLCQEIS
jgi:isochorismate hydrolase